MEVSETLKNEKTESDSEEKEKELPNNTLGDVNSVSESRQKGKKINTDILESVALKECLKYYDALPGEDETIPRYMLVFFFGDGCKDKHTPKKRWKYIDGNLIEEPTDKELERNPRSGMYHYYAGGNFYYNLEKGKVFINIYFGPLFGRGYVYDIILGDDGSIRLGNRRMRWIS